MARSVERRPSLFKENVEFAKAVTVTGAMNVAGAVAFTGGAMFGTVGFYSGAGVPVDYTDGTPPATGEGVAAKGSLYVDQTNGKLYVNGGTLAQPLWKIVTSA